MWEYNEHEGGARTAVGNPSTVKLPSANAGGANNPTDRADFYQEMGLTIGRVCVSRRLSLGFRRHGRGYATRRPGVDSISPGHRQWRRKGAG